VQELLDIPATSLQLLAQDHGQFASMADFLLQPLGLGLNHRVDGSGR
jgi:hypothetical protein